MSQDQLVLSVLAAAGPAMLKQWKQILASMCNNCSVCSLV